MRARSPSRGVLGSVALALLLPGMAAGAIYRLRAESRLVVDQWRGGRPDPQDRFDVRQRLALGVYRLLEPDPRRPARRLYFTSDLAVGTDLAPSQGALDAAQDARRADFDLYVAYLRAEQVLPWIDASLGRHLIADELGWDAVDGLTLTGHVAPFLALDLTGGAAARRGWSAVGPDRFDLDGTALPETPAYVTGVALGTRRLAFLDARLAWRARFDADRVQRDEAGAGLTLRWDPIRLSAGTRYDLIFERGVSHRAGVGWATEGSPQVLGGGVELAWRRERPLFSADSIWNIFGAEPYDDATLSGSLGPLGGWRLQARLGARRFESGDPSPEKPCAPAPGALEAGCESAAPEARPIAWEGGVRAERAVLERLGEAGSLGLEARAARGYGGERTAGDLFGEVPLRSGLGGAALRLRGRLGALWLRETTFEQQAGLMGWLLLGMVWRPSETTTVELVAEETPSRWTPSRLRFMGHLKVQDWY